MTYIVHSLLKICLRINFYLIQFFGKTKLALPENNVFFNQLVIIDMLIEKLKTVNIPTIVKPDMMLMFLLSKQLLQNLKIKRLPTL